MDKFFAGLGLLLCAGLAWHMAAGPARRQRFDQAWRKYLGRWSASLAATWAAAMAAIRRRRTRPPASKPVDAVAAQREAEEVIARARRRRQEADHDGNVIRPRAFDTSKKKPPLH